MIADDPIQESLIVRYCKRRREKERERGGGDSIFVQTYSVMDALSEMYPAKNDASYIHEPTQASQVTTANTQEIDDDLRLVLVNY